MFTSDELENLSALSVVVRYAELGYAFFGSLLALRRTFMRRSSHFGRIALVVNLSVLMAIAVCRAADPMGEPKPSGEQPTIAAKDVKPEYSANAARDLVDTACQTAAKESKLVFLKSGYPECIWCRTFDKYHSTPEVRDIVGKYFVVAEVDTENMPDGKDVFTAFAQPGAPSWVILTPDKKVLIDSYAETNGKKVNVGFPGAPEEKEYYQAALKKTVPKITQAELDVLGTQLQKFTDAVLKPKDAENSGPAISH
jgi:hypothetical protein